jgi:hypothetical protein
VLGTLRILQHLIEEVENSYRFLSPLVRKLLGEPISNFSHHVEVIKPIKDSRAKDVDIGRVRDRVGFDNLPPEILQIIFEHAFTHYARSKFEPFTRISKKTLAVTRPILLKRVSITGPCLLKSLSRPECGDTIGSYLRELKISNLGYSQVEDCFSLGKEEELESLLQLLKHATSLKSLNILFPRSNHIFPPGTKFDLSRILKTIEAGMEGRILDYLTIHQLSSSITVLASTFDTLSRTDLTRGLSLNLTTFPPQPFGSNFFPFSGLTRLNIQTSNIDPEYFSRLLTPNAITLEILEIEIRRGGLNAFFHPGIDALRKVLPQITFPKLKTLNLKFPKSEIPSKDDDLVQRQCEEFLRVLFLTNKNRNVLRDIGIEGGIWLTRTLSSVGRSLYITDEDVNSRFECFNTVERLYISIYASSPDDSPSFKDFASSFLGFEEGSNMKDWGGLRELRLERSAWEEKESLIRAMCDLKGVIVREGIPRDWEWGLSS